MWATYIGQPFAKPLNEFLAQKRLKLKNYKGKKQKKNLQTEARRVARACRDIGRLSLEMVKIIILMLNVTTINC